MTVLLLVRHGETADNIAGVYSGLSEVPLTPDGAAAVRELARMLAADARLATARILSSPVRRAAETARLLENLLGICGAVDPRLAELDFGAWTGLDGERISHEFAEDWQIWRDRPAIAVPTGGESLASMFDRIRAVSAQLEPPTIVVGHETGLRLMLCALLNVGLERYRDWQIEPGAAVLIGNDGGLGWSIEAQLSGSGVG